MKNIIVFGSLDLINSIDGGEWEKVEALLNDGEPYATKIIDTETSYSYSEVKDFMKQAAMYGEYTTILPKEEPKLNKILNILPK